MVGGIKLTVEADRRGLGRSIDAVGQLIAFAGFLPAGLEYAHAGHQLVHQLGQLLLGIALAALHRALGVAALFGGRIALLLQCGASGL